MTNRHQDQLESPSRIQEFSQERSQPNHPPLTNEEQMKGLFKIENMSLLDQVMQSEVNPQIESDLDKLREKI